MQGAWNGYWGQWWHPPSFQIVEDSVVMVSEGLFEIHFEAAALPVKTFCRTVASMLIILEFLDLSWRGIEVLCGLFVCLFYL